MGFYDLSEAERIALTRKAIAEHRTLIERWGVLELPEAAPWNERAALASALLANCASVADLGCGRMWLERHLKPSTQYLPVDVVARDDRTIVVDLNQQPLPALNVEGWAALGLLEYLFDVPSLFRDMSRTVVTSYNPVDLGNERRLSHAWINAYDTLELEAVFVGAGWSIVERATLGSQRVWKLVK